MTNLPVFLAALLAASTAAAEEPARPAASPAEAPLAKLLDAAALTPPGGLRADRLVYDWYTDGAVTGLAGGLWVTTELLKPSLSPPSCQWCSRNALDDSVTRALGWEDIHLASTISNVVAFGAFPVMALGTLGYASWREGRLDGFPGDVLVVAESVVLSAALNQTVKYIAGRERPFVAELTPEEKGKTSEPADNNLSFYSGHSAFAFALAVSAGTVAHLRGYEAEPYVWGVGLPVASFVVYSRLAAKKHYFTDVMVGTLAGSAFGFGVPWLLHRAEGRMPASLTLLPTGDGLAVAGSF